MIIFPSVDIQHGRCVRLLQGRPEASTEYYASPVEAALHWQAEGAEALHVVDLDGTLSESTENWPHLAEVLGSLEIPVEVAGGLRDRDAVDRVMAAGAARAVIGTRAAEDPDWAREMCRAVPGRIVIAVDALEGEVVVRGWREGSGLMVLDLAQRLEEAGPAAFLYTDVARDGMLTRPHFEGVRSLLEATTVPVIASGGVAKLDDIRRLGECGADAVIVGKALYENCFELAEALAVAQCYSSRLVPRPE